MGVDMIWWCDKKYFAKVYITQLITKIFHQFYHQFFSRLTSRKITLQETFFLEVSTLITRTLR